MSLPRLGARARRLALSGLLLATTSAPVAHAATGTQISGSVAGLASAPPLMPFTADAYPRLTTPVQQMVAGKAVQVYPLKTTVLDDGERVLADRLIIHYQPTTTDADRASVSHSGLGTVACRVGGASTSCSTPFPYGTTVTLTATGTSNPRLGIFWGFDHWEGACTGTVRTCTVTMTAARSVKAVFVDGS